MSIIIDFLIRSRGSAQIKMTLTTADGIVCSEGEALHIGAREKQGRPTLSDVFEERAKL